MSMNRPAIRLVVSLIVLALACRDGAAAEVRVADFGVKADGQTDDGPAIRNAIAAAIAAGPGARVIFEKGTYRLGPHKGGGGQISLTGVDGLTIDGNDSTLLLHPSNGVFDLRKCHNVTIRGFTIDFDPLPFTQGTIRTVDAAAGTFDLEIHDGYPLPPADALVKKQLGAGGGQWGTVIDPVERHRRWDVSDHYFIDAVNALADRTFRITVTQPYAERLKPVRPGDRFFLPLELTATGERAFGGNITIAQSSDCTLENFTIHTARNGMNFSISRNEGRIALRSNRITFKPDSSHICTTWKDGMHVKDNRVGPLIEGCFFEGMLDDSINLSANTAMAVEVFSPSEFQLMGASFAAGDRVMAFDPASGKILVETKVVEIKTRDKKPVVVLADPVDPVVVGQKRPHADIKGTHFYNMSYVNDGFVVRNCTFKPQRRHAVLVRASNGIIERNTVDGVGGAAVSMGNEMGSFYEGPFPTNNIIRENTIRNTQLPAIQIYTSKLGGKAYHTGNIRIERNTITVLPDKQGISIRAAQKVTLTGNRILNADGTDCGEAGVKVVDSTGVQTE